MATKKKLSVYIFGAGKVGVALAQAIRRAGLHVTLRAARAGIPGQSGDRGPVRRIDADLLILTVRDRDLTSTAARFAEAGIVSPATGCVHVAGAQRADVLEPLRAVSAGIAQMHPMISFASLHRFPALAGGHVHLQGDPGAVAPARCLIKALGMTARTFPDLDPVGYHAAAGLVANGAAALAAVGVRVLATAGVPPEVAPHMLGPLLHSVADNVMQLGFPDALTGPVRRGESQSVSRHLEVLRARLPEAVPLFVAAGLAQLPLARALGEAPAAAFDAIETVLRDAPNMAPTPSTASVFTPRTAETPRE